jgi:ribose 5-phosphate isomerase
MIFKRGKSIRKLKGPIVTDSGNFLIDWKFETKNQETNQDYDWKSINMSIKMIPGNLFCWSFT